MMGDSPSEEIRILSTHSWITFRSRVTLNKWERGKEEERERETDRNIERQSDRDTQTDIILKTKTKTEVTNPPGFARAASRPREVVGRIRFAPRFSRRRRLLHLPSRIQSRKVCPTTRIRRLVSSRFPLAHLQW